MAKARGLGRGLDTLFGEESKDQIEGIKINDIEPNVNQPRKVFNEEALTELAESIRQNGVITPIALRKTGETYQIIAGERRWRASRMAGLTHIPAIVLDVDEKTAFQYAMVENLQREDLNPIEEAKGFHSLMKECDLTQEQAAEKVGKSRSAVANSLRLLQLPTIVRVMVEQGDLTAGHARAILSLPSVDLMEKLARIIAKDHLNVRQAEEMAKSMLKKRPEKKSQESSFYIKELIRELESATSHKISIVHGKNKGKITVEYSGNEDLEKICLALKKIEN